MVKKKTFIISRVVFGLIFGLGLFVFIYWQQNKNNPELIEKIEALKAEYYYKVDSNGYYDNDAIIQIADSFLEIFNPPLLEFDASLADIYAGKNTVVFVYYFANTHAEHHEPNYYLNQQKTKFCRNATDLERLKHLDGYQFDYYKGQNIDFSIKLTYSICQNAAQI